MTIKAEVLIALSKATVPLTAHQLLDQLDREVTMMQVGPALSELKAQGLVEPAGKSAPVEGERVMTLWVITTAGREVLKETDGKAPRGGVSRKPRKVKRRANGAHKAKQKTKAGSRAARKAWKTRRAAARAGLCVPRTDLRKTNTDTPAAPRWAFTGERSLVLLNTPVEIPAPAVRALVKFLQQLDETLVLEPEA